ncbi:MAG: hypothetical protein QOF90_2984, partial [Acetobacteraceae bacterium]|nr:hypothetical protein [Acetobacteraceae bacterium]
TSGTGKIPVRTRGIHDLVSGHARKANAREPFHVLLFGVFRDRTMVA